MNIKKSLFFIVCAFVIMPLAYAKLTASKFPTTVDDIPFEQQTDINSMTKKYTPFLTEKQYRELEITPGEEVYLDSMFAKAEEQLKTNPTLPGTGDFEPPPETRQSCNVNFTIGDRGPVVENNFVTGGSCYPAERENYFTNKILTSGKYEKIHPAFEKGLIVMFRKEGGCGRTPNDPCGWTCYGIGESPDCAGVHVDTREQAETVYYKRYWENYKLYKLPDVIATDIFVAGAGGGTGTNLNRFRKMLGLKGSSKPVDQEMINAVNNYKGDIHNDWLNIHFEALKAAAKARYGSNPTNYANVLKSWTKGVQMMRKNGCHTCPQQPQKRQ